MKVAQRVVSASLTLILFHCFMGPFFTLHYHQEQTTTPTATITTKPYFEYHLVSANMNRKLLSSPTPVVSDLRKLNREKSGPEQKLLPTSLRKLPSSGSNPHQNKFPSHA